MTFRIAATRGRSRSSPSIWKDESSSTTASTFAPERTSSQAGVPRFPPVKVVRSRAKSAPASAVVVLFPFVPVMATMRAPSRKRAASSTSPQTGTPRARAAPSSGIESGTPGDTTTRSARSKSEPVVPAERAPDREPVERGERAGEILRGATVGDGDRGPLARAEPRGGDAALREPDHGDLPALELRCAHVPPQLDRHERDEREHDGEDPEADDDLGLRPALQLEVVVDRRHPEDALAGRAERTRPAG